MLMIKGVQRETGFNGNLGNNGIQNADSVAWIRSGEMFKCEVAGIVGRPQQREILQRLTHLLLFRFCVTPLNQLHHDNSGQGNRLAAVGGQPGQGRWLATQNIHHDIGVANDHDNDRFWDFSRKDLAKALLSARFLSFQIPTRGDAAKSPAVPAIDGAVTAGDTTLLTYLLTRKQ